MSDDRERDAGKPGERDEATGLVRGGSRALTHGRRLEWTPGDESGRGDTLAIRDPGGRVEVTITLDAGGPTVQVRGARLEIATPEELAVDCRKLALRTREGLDLEAGGDFRVRSGKEIRMKSKRSAFLDADWVNLNCLDRTGYHDEHLAAGSDPDREAGDEGAGDPRDRDGGE